MDPRDPHDNDPHAHDVPDEGAHEHDMRAHDMPGHDHDGHDHPAHDHDAHAQDYDRTDSTVPADAPTGRHSAPDRDQAESMRPATRERRPRRNRMIIGLLGAVGATVITLFFAGAFLGALHSPGPRSVPIGYVGSPAQASALGGALNRAEPGAFVVKPYPNAVAARNAIIDRHTDAALLPVAGQLLVSTAAGDAAANSTARVFESAANSAGVNLGVINVRPLHPSDPQGLAQVLYVITLFVPSMVFGYLLVRLISPRLNALLQLAILAVYAAIVSAVATAIADAGISALTGQPWGLFGIGTLIAFTAAVVGAAAARWFGRIGFTLFFLLLVAVGISASGLTLGPRMISSWYADLGKALPPGSGMRAVQNTTYFSGNQIITPLLVMSAWALGGMILMALAAFIHPRAIDRMPGSLAAADHAAAERSEEYEAIGARERGHAELSSESERERGYRSSNPR